MSTKRTLKIFDVPTSAGCLEAGTDLFPAHLKKYGLIAALGKCGFAVTDLGSVPLPKLIRNNEHPIRNWI